jgi:PhoPQ-activated pathogenicity-related protein
MKINKDVVFSLGGLAVIVVSALTIGKTLSSQELPGCAVEILEVTNNINFTQTMLLAPANITNSLKLNLPDNVLQQEALTTIAAGISPAGGGKVSLYIKTFIQTKDDSPVAKETRSALSKSKNNCQMLGEEYEVYTGSAIM